MRSPICIAVLAATAALTLAGCAGGPGKVRTSLDYTPAADARHTYEPHETGSHISTHLIYGERLELHIGGDVGPREPLRHVATENGIRYYLGASRDGVGVDRIKNYETDLLTQDGDDPRGLDGHGFRPFSVKPYLYWDPDLWDIPENNHILWALFDSVRILNDALPPEFQISLQGDRAIRIAAFGEIMVNLETPGSIAVICGETAVACATFRRIGNHTSSAVLYLPDDFDTSHFTYSRTVIVHELLHALGIQGHVDSIEFPDSIMGKAASYFPNLGHILSRIDREVLQIMYMSQDTETYNDYGEWSDTSFHLVGRSEDEALEFGVALFNGLPQPWVRGTVPDGPLNQNRRLYGTATWRGSLLGFSGPSPIAGDAELQVHLATLSDFDNEQDLRFRDIYFVNRIEDEDLSPTSSRWFDTRNIDYKVNVLGYTFYNVTGDDYEPGHVSGAFFGAGHEHMGGTVKRTDLVGAFGGTR